MEQLSLERADAISAKEKQSELLLDATQQYQQKLDKLNISLGHLQAGLVASAQEHNDEIAQLKKLHKEEVMTLTHTHKQQFELQQTQAALELDKLKLTMTGQVETLTASLNEAQHQRLMDVQSTTSKYDEVLATLQMDFAQEREELNDALGHQMRRHLDEVKNLKAVHRLDIASAVGIVQQRVRQVEAELKSLQEQASQPLPSAISGHVNPIATSSQFQSAIDSIWQAVKDCHEDVGDTVDSALQVMQSVAVDHDHAVQMFEAKTEHLKNVLAAQMQADAEVRVSVHADSCDRFVQSIIRDTHTLWQGRVDGLAVGEAPSQEEMQDFLSILQRKEDATSKHLQTLILQNEELLKHNDAIRVQLQLASKRAFSAQIELVQAAAAEMAKPDILRHTADALVALQTAYRSGLSVLESRMQAKVTDAVRNALVHAHAPLDAAKHLMTTAAVIQLEHPSVVAERNSCRKLALAAQRILGESAEVKDRTCQCKESTSVLVPKAQQIWEDASGLQDAVCSQQFKKALHEAKQAREATEQECKQTVDVLQQKHSTAMREAEREFNLELKSAKELLQETRASADKESTRLQQVLDAESRDLGTARGDIADLKADVRSLEEEVKSLEEQIKQEAENKARSKTAIEQVLKQVEKATTVMHSSASHTVAQAVAHSAASATAQKAIASAASSEVQRLKALIADAHARLKVSDRSHVLALQAKGQAEEQLVRAKSALQQARAENGILAKELQANRSVVADLLMKVQAYQPVAAASHSLPSTDSPSVQRSVYMDFIHSKNLQGSQPRSNTMSPKVRSPISPGTRRSPGASRVRRTMVETPTGSPRDQRGEVVLVTSPREPVSETPLRTGSKRDSRSVRSMIRAHIMRTDSTNGLGFKRYGKQSGTVGFGTPAVQRKTLKPRE